MSSAKANKVLAPIKATVAKVDLDAERKVDPYTLAEIGLSGIGIIAPILMRDMYAPQIFNFLHSSIYGDSAGKSQETLDQEIALCSKVTNVSWNLVAIFVGLIMLYVSQRTSREKEVRYAAVPLILANCTYIVCEMRR